MIGLFDSGVGGLSVFREVYRRLPGQSFAYYSDNAHCPYGEKSKEYVTARAREIVEFLAGQGADVVVIACNTATAAAIATLRQEYADRSNPQVRERVLKLTGGRRDHLRFIGVEPAIKPAAKLTRSGVVGVLATAGTLSGEKYHNTRDMYSAGVKVVEHIGSGFVELVESGRTTGPEAESVVEASLRPLLEQGADTIVLGCTHYPFLSETIAKVAERIAPERDVKIIEPAPAVTSRLIAVMQEEGLPTTDEKNAGKITLHCSGDPAGLNYLFNTLF